MCVCVCVCVCVYIYIYIYIYIYQKQQRLERTREHHQKLQFYKHHNDNKFISFSTHSKCQWTKYANQKTWGNKMDKKTRSIYILFTGDTF